MKFKFFLSIGFILLISDIQAQAPAARWQQRVSYRMDIQLDVETHRFQGKQQIIYQNNSPDTLKRVFYHLYFNAFQPNSSMDVRSRTVPDPDPRVGSRIQGLSPTEIGYQRVISLNQDGRPASIEVVGTILEVNLPSPILPNSSTVLDMDFEAQVPVQVRRSGRNSREGIAYSMAQWYPKLCEYDYQGWHANPYVAREFYGVWGDFEVRITLDSRYVVGGTGYLLNADEVGHGYGDGKQPNNQGELLSWHFLAPNVHDFMWAADPDYTHTTLKRKNGTVLHFLYQKTETNAQAWAQLPRIMDRAFDFIEENYGPYPYQQYSFIQGGDGGMEYPMATLITGERKLPSLVGVSIHELMHSWYQMILGTNESLYHWMDEGFADYATAEVKNFLRREGLLDGKTVDNPHRPAIQSYLEFAKSGWEEPMSLHADHYMTNQGYSVASYTKGEVLLTQLQYIMGEQAFRKGMLDYYWTWRFRHPNPIDFFRIMEKTADLELDWFREYQVNTTHTVDYAIRELVAAEEGKSRLMLTRSGLMPMPLDVELLYTDGSREILHIPLDLMRGYKPVEPRYADAGYTVLPDWFWTHPLYEAEIHTGGKTLQQVRLDPSGRLADSDSSNNSLVLVKTPPAKEGE